MRSGYRRPRRPHPAPVTRPPRPPRRPPIADRRSPDGPPCQTAPGQDHTANGENVGRDHRSHPARDHLAGPPVGHRVLRDAHRTYRPRRGRCGNDLDRRARRRRLADPLLYAELDAADITGLARAQRAGYRVVDVMLDLTHPTSEAPDGTTTAATTRMGTAADVDALDEQLQAVAPWSRFAADPRFGIDAAAALHRAWVERAVAEDRRQPSWPRTPRASWASRRSASTPTPTDPCPPAATGASTSSPRPDPGVAPPSPWCGGLEPSGPDRASAARSRPATSPPALQ